MLIHKMKPADHEPLATVDDDSPHCREWREPILYGIGCFMFAGVDYWVMVGLEAQGQRPYRSGLFSWLYTLGGKWPVCSVFIAMGIYCIILGIIRCRQSDS